VFDMYYRCSRAGLVSSMYDITTLIYIVNSYLVLDVYLDDRKYYLAGMTNDVFNLACINILETLQYRIYNPHLDQVINNVMNYGLSGVETYMFDNGNLYSWFMDKQNNTSNYVKYLLDSESKCQVLTCNKNISMRNRKILVTWLITVAYKITRSKPQTEMGKSGLSLFHRAISFLDQFLNSDNKVTTVNLQLYGICCLALASEMVSDYCKLNINTIVYICDKIYNGDEITNAQKLIGHTVELMVLSQDYLVLFPDDIMACISKYIVEVCLVDGNLLKDVYPSELIAAIGLLLSDIDMWSQPNMFGYEESHLYPIVNNIVVLLQEHSSNTSDIYQIFPDKQLVDSLQIALCKYKY